MSHSSKFIEKEGSVSSEDISSCLARNASMLIFMTRNISITFTPKRTLVLSNTAEKVRMCKLKISTEPTQALQVELLYQTCMQTGRQATVREAPTLRGRDSLNFVHFLHKFYIPRRLPVSILSSRIKSNYYSLTELWTGCESVRDPLRKVVSRINSTVVTLTVGHLHEQYSVSFAVSITKPPRGRWPARLRTSFVTASMGKESFYLSRSLADRWGTTVEFTTSFLHSSQFSACRVVTP